MTLPDEVIDEVTRLRHRLAREHRARLEAEEIAERSTRELYDREQSFRALFADNPYPMWVYDRETLRILEVNSAAVASYGYPRETFLSMTIEDIRPPEDLTRLRADLSAPRPDLQHAGQWRHRLQDGRVIDVDVMSHVLRFADRPAVLVLAQDVTARNDLEAAKSTFLTAVSHELRTPLTSLLGFARTLSRHDADLSPEVRRECVDGLAIAARRLDQLVADLLDVDRLSRGILLARRRRVDVGAIVRRIVRDFGTARPVHVSAPAVVASVDPAMVERIMENLVANALAHTADGVEVWVAVTASEEGVLLCVDDAGPGVPEHVRDSIFRVFEHGPRVREHAPGLGVGLALVAHLAALHGGRAWIEERPGGGAALRVLLRHEPPDSLSDPARATPSRRGD